MITSVNFLVFESSQINKVIFYCDLYEICCIFKLCHNILNCKQKNMEEHLCNNAVQAQIIVNFTCTYLA